MGGMGDSIFMVGLKIQASFWELPVKLPNVMPLTTPIIKPHISLVRLINT